MSTIIKNLPNLLTICNLLIGTFAIVEIFQGNYRNALFYVLVSGLFDFLDGFVARLVNAKSDLGGQLDSLADMVSFSVVPALFLFRHLQMLGWPTLAHLALLIAAFSAWRLAKFNIDESQSDVFKGVPTPANAVLITSLIYLDVATDWVWGLIVVASCLLLVAPVKMLALKFSSYGVQGNEFRYLLVVSSISILALLGTQGILFIIPCYILLSFLANFIPGYSGNRDSQ